ncbi:MAG: dipicolinate synthase subunit DpsA [Ruminococcus sp.]
MQTDKVILVAGGDLRQCYAAKKLAELPGWMVQAAGFVPDALENSGVVCCGDDLYSAAPYDVLVLPIPASTDGETVQAPFGKQPLPLRALAEHGKPGALVLGGQCTEAVKHCFAAAGMETEDYLRREELCLSNAVPTAEGAIQIAMEETISTLDGGTALIVGYGRIGMALAPRLRGLGMTVNVCARRCETRALAVMQGCCAMPMTELEQAAAKSTLVLNTVPAPVLTEQVLRALPADALVIDLASRPGGTDFAAAKKLGIRVVWALSLPPEVRCCHRETVENAVENGLKPGFYP